MWLLRSDIPWLVQYLADEIATRGVAIAPAVAGETVAADQSAVADGSSSDGPRANCSDVPELCIRLKPAAGNLDEYEALFVDGPLKGFKLTSKVSSVRPSGPRHEQVNAVIQILQETMAARLANART